MTAQLPLPASMDAGAVPIGAAASLVEDEDGGRVFVHGELSYGWDAGDAVSRRFAAAKLADIKVRGKARRQDRLPLPSEVGEALAAYLSSGRDPADAVHVFLTSRAPRGSIRADLVGDVVERACKRAGLPNVGPQGAAARPGS